MATRTHSWKALESSPDSINPFLSSIGVKSVKLVDIFSFDSEALEFVPKPQYAVIFCFPEYDRVRSIMKDIYDVLIAAGEEEEIKSKNVFFMHQKIENACGTFALFHSLGNLESVVDLGSGSFKKWLEAAKKVSVEERSDLLAKDNDIASAHDSAAGSGSTEQPEKVDHHFICYINKDGVLYEVDSSAPFPRPLGATSYDTLVRDAGEACRHLMEKLDNVSFAAMALVDNID